LVADYVVQDRPLIIRSQYGDDSIALVQWAYDNKLENVQVVYVDTGFAAEKWKERIERGEEHARKCGFQPVRIVSSISFAEAVKGRGEFPSSKFQWCSALLKGLPFLDWLEGWDLKCNAILLIAKRKGAATAHETLPEWIEKCEFHNHRTVWHAILNVDKHERNGLLDRAGFEPLNHRSLECEPCVNSSLEDLARLNTQDYDRIKTLEQTMPTTLFTEAIDLTVERAKTTVNKPNQPRIKDKYLDLFYRGCGNHFGCGL
jgi:hypothetical protein